MCKGLDKRNKILRKDQEMCKRLDKRYKIFEKGPGNMQKVG